MAGGIRVQRGTAVWGASSPTLDVPIEAVALGRAFARLTSVTGTNRGRSGGDDPTTLDLRDLAVVVELADSTTLRLTRPAGADASVDYAADWELWEFVGSAGDAHEWVVRGTGVEVLAGASAEVAPADPVADPARAIAIRAGLSLDAVGATDVASMLVTADVTAGGNLRLERGEAAAPVSVSWAIVELVGSAWTVERFEHSFSADGTDESVALTVPAWPQTFLLASQRVPAGQSGLDETGYTLRPGAANEALARLRAGADAPGTGYALVGFAVTSAAIEVERFQTFGAASILAAATSWTATVPTAVALDATAAILSVATAGSGAATPRANWDVEHRTLTTLRARRGRSGQEAEAAVQSVRFPQAPIEIELGTTAAAATAPQLEGAQVEIDLPEAAGAAVAPDGVQAVLVVVVEPPASATTRSAAGVELTELASLGSASAGALAPPSIEAAVEVPLEPAAAAAVVPEFLPAELELALGSAVAVASAPELAAVEGGLVADPPMTLHLEALVWPFAEVAVDAADRLFRGGRTLVALERDVPAGAIAVCAVAATDLRLALGVPS